MLIAQLSDVHVGGGRYREELLRAAIEEINTAAPDLVVVAGDLTDEGYPDQYPLAKEELSALACPLIVRVPGNHDARNVGYLHFEDTFGARDSRLRLELDRLKVALVAVDSSKPDLDEGEIGREYYGWIEEGFAGGSPSSSACPAAGDKAWGTTRATVRPSSPPATPTHSCAPNAESRWRRMRRQPPRACDAG
jgi:3',5'-cyclic AMP phosphodiesterase CpdA